MKRKKYLILLVLLVLIGALFTYAMYRSETKASASFEVAKWNVNVKVNGVSANNDIINVSLMDREWKNDISYVAEGKIAPGSYTTFDIEIDATGTEVPVEYQVLFDNLDELPGFSIEINDQEGIIQYSKELPMLKIIPVTVRWNADLSDSKEKDKLDISLNNKELSLDIRILTSQKLTPLCNITYDLNDGSEVSVVKIEKNKSIINLPKPSKIGYIFKGWYTDKEEGDLVTTSTKVVEDVTYYAHWDIKTILVTFNSHGGSEVTSLSIMQGSRLADLSEPIKEDYIFIGWYTKEVGGEKITGEEEILDNITLHARYEKQDLGKVVYFDPVSNDICNEYTYSIDKIRSNESTCYKWRIISSDNDTASIQLDHNLVNKTKWNSNTSKSSDGPVLALQELESLTTNWNRVLPINYTYDTSKSINSYGTLSCSFGTCYIEDKYITNSLRARLITAEEIMDIINTKADSDALSRTWTLQNTNSIFFSSLSIRTGYTDLAFGDNKLSWLIENTSSSNITGSTSNLYGEDNDGYWTLSPSSKNNTYAGIITKYGDYETYILYDNNYGLRPVINVSKTDLN